MKKNIPEIEELVRLISKLPGLGPKSAKRIVLKLINNREELIKPLAIHWPKFIKISSDVTFVEISNLRIPAALSKPAHIQIKIINRFVW